MEARENPELRFGQLLRAHRLAAGLTQEALAERAGLSVRAISDLERGLKTRPHFETVRMLADALELDQSARATLISAARPAVVPSTPSSPRAAVSDLPLPLTSLVGRERELAETAALIHSGARLLTLTGPGGVGKTRLALRLAEDLRPDFDAVAFVGLAAVADEGFVLPAVAQALAVRETPGQLLLETIVDHLRAQRLLLVLDNCEHVLAGVQGLVVDLLKICAGMTVLATSRARLHLQEEQLYPVPSLALPDPDHLPDLEQLGQIEAVALFVARARAVRPDFVLAEAQAPDVADICRRLDGLPLAIELTAVRLRLLSPSAMLALLSNRLRLLKGGPQDAPSRHQTMEETIAWSYDLLDLEEQALFQQLAVFHGGCTLVAAMAVAATDDEIVLLGGLQSLTDQSLVHVTEGPDGESRFGMLETIREFALARLSAAGDESETRARHAAYFLDLAELGEKELTGPDQARWVKCLDAEHDNFRASLRWSLERPGDDDTALRLGGALWRYWDRVGHLREGRSWLTQALDRGDKTASLSRANALMGLANLSFEDRSRGSSHYEESLALFEELGEKSGQARSLTGLGMIASDTGKFDEAVMRFEKALAIWREVGNKRGEVTVLLHLGRLLDDKSEFDRARELLFLALDICRELHDIELLVYSHLLLGRIARRQGEREVALHHLERTLAISREVDNAHATGLALIELGLFRLEVDEPTSATSALREALTDFTSLGDELGIVFCLEGFARVARSSDQAEIAVQLWSAADFWRESTASPLPALEQEAQKLDLECLRQELGKEHYSVLWSQGRKLSLQRAAELALGFASDLLPMGNDGSTSTTKFTPCA